MDQQLHDTPSSEYAFSVAEQRHKDTVSELRRLREEFRAREDVTKRLRASLGDRFDAEMECRLLKAQIKKLQEDMLQVVGEDQTPLKVEATSGQSSKQQSGTASAAAVQTCAQKSKSCVAKLPLEYLADILSYLDRFSLDHIEFTCPKLRAAVATLDGQNLRSLDSLRLVYAGSNGGDWGPGPFSRCGGRGRHARGGLGAAVQNYLTAHAAQFTIVAECSSHPMALKHGATRTDIKLSWNFIGTPRATSHFVGVLRNASVRRLSLSAPLVHHFVQALSAAGVDVAVGSMAVDRFVPEVANLPIACEALMAFNRLETLAINDAPLKLLSDDFLLAATHKCVTSIELKSNRFNVHNEWGWNTRSHWQVHAAGGSESIYPELCDGLLAFLFRDDVDDSAKVELCFPAARVPKDFCLRLMEAAISAGARYSISASFVAVHEVDARLTGFEDYRRLDVHDPNLMIYEVPDPSVTDVTVELKFTAVDSVVESGGWNAQQTSWKLVDFRRYRKSDELRSENG